MGLMTKLRRPLVCAGIAASLATALVVTTPSNAEAFAGPALGALAKEGAAVAGANFSGFIGMMLGEEAGGWVDKAFAMEPEKPVDPLGNIAWFDAQEAKMWGYLNGIFAANEDVSIPFAESADMWDVNSSVWNGVEENSFTDTRNKPGDVTPGPAASTFEVKSMSFITGTQQRQGVTVTAGPTTDFTTGSYVFSGYGVANVVYQCRGVSGGNLGVVTKGSQLFVSQSVKTKELNPSQTSSKGATLCNSSSSLDSVQVEPPSAEQVAQVKAAQPGDGVFPVVNTSIMYAPNYVPEDQGYRTRVTCVNPATGAESYLWYTTPIGAGALVIPSCREAGVGTFAREIATDFVEGGTVRRPMIKTRPKEDPLVGDESWTDCDPMFGPVCVMEIYVDGKKCEMLAPACVDWITHNSANPGAVECRYGGRVVHISYCAGMEVKYRGHPVAQDPKNYDGNPLTVNPDAPTKPQVDPEKNPNYDPNDSPLEKPSDDPTEWKVPLPSPDLPPWETEGQPEPPVDPEPTDPSTGPSAPPSGPGVDVVNPPVAPPGTSTTCWGAKASWNPIEWVYQPVVCALQSAFQPSKPIQQRVTSMSSQFSDRVPMSWFGIGTQGISGGSCPTSWKVEFRGESHSLICGTAADEAIRSFRPVMGAMLVIAALFPLLRSLFYSAIPLFRVTPS